MKNLFDFVLRNLSFSLWIELYRQFQ